MAKKKINKKKAWYEQHFGSLGFDPVEDPDSGFQDENKDFRHVKRLARAVDAQKVKLERLHLPSWKYFKQWKSRNHIQMADTYLRIKNADTSFPVILDWDNQLLDGNHRVCKAIIEGLTWIPCYKIDLYAVIPTRYGKDSKKDKKSKVKS